VARKVILIAGGIGVTPLTAQLRAPTLQGHRGHSVSLSSVSALMVTAS
jgi:ferredoxin-NADP reductase